MIASRNRSVSPVNDVLDCVVVSIEIALGLSAEEFEEFKKSEGFPARERKGWDVDAIKSWIESAPEGADNPETAKGDEQDAQSNDDSGSDPGSGESPSVGNRGDSEYSRSTESNAGGSGSGDSNAADDDRQSASGNRIEEATSPPYRTVIIEVPICDPEEGSYIGQGRGHIDVRLDRQTQLPAFRHIHAGFRAANATLPNDKPVESAADVVRYLAVLVASEMENGDVND